MMKKYVEYQINIICEINKHNVVIPCGGSNSIIDFKTKEYINMIGMPEWTKVVTIWMGEYFKYPKIKKQNDKT